MVRETSPAARPAHVGQARGRLPGVRLPYGTPVTLGVLRPRSRAAEAALRALGFTELRVRHYGDLARIEVPLDR